MILSIIIPMYKVEHYIESCLLSCLKQDIPSSEYEIICVDDGSPDNSALIAENISKQYGNIRIISQKNKGLSAARNAGLDKAEGDYVWFVDSDDWIEEYCLGRIVSKLTDDIDILQLQYRKVFLNPYRVVEVRKCSIEGIRTGREITVNGGLPVPAPFSVYRRNFLLNNGLRFFPGIYHEDSEFKPKATYLAQRVSSDDEVSYNYLQRDSGSITSTFSLKRVKDILLVNDHLYSFSRFLERDCMLAFNGFIGTNMNTLLLMSRRLDGEEYRKLKNILSYNKRFFKCMRHSKNMKYKIEGHVFCMSVGLGLRLHSLIR